MKKLLCCLSFLLLSDAHGNELITLHSRNMPSQLWEGLDATVEEVKKDGRVSIFKTSRHSSHGTEAALGRFFGCVVMHTAKKRGFVGFVNAEPVNDHHVVIYLKNNDDDIREIIDKEYRDLRFYGRLNSTGFELIEVMCKEVLP